MRVEPFGEQEVRTIPIDDELSVDRVYRLVETAHESADPIVRSAALRLALRSLREASGG